MITKQSLNYLSACEMKHKVTEKKQRKSSIAVYEDAMKLARNRYKKRRSVKSWTRKFTRMGQEYVALRTKKSVWKTR